MTRDDFCLKSLIRPVIDFPKAGVIFRDITPLYPIPPRHARHCRHLYRTLRRG